MKKPRVFAIQIPARKDKLSGKWVEKYDIKKAEVFGDIIRILPYGNVSKDPEPTRMRLIEAFFSATPHSFNYDTDYVLLLGDIIAIAQAISVLEAKRPVNKSISVLKWDRYEMEYQPYNIG